ncbi:MAG: hypothetical protein ACYDBV_00880 [Nitrospiria bacterium]
MVKKIKRKIKITPFTRYVISLSMIVSPLYAPERKKTFLSFPFDPPDLLKDFFTRHFQIDLITADRFILFKEYSRWVSSTRPGEAMKAGMKSGIIPFPDLNEATGENSSSDPVFLPILGVATEAEWEELFDQWTEGFSEIQATAFRHLIEPGLGIVPGIDRCLFMGPSPAKQINQIILYLHGRVSDECQLNRWPIPSLFPILDFDIVERIPVKSPVSF